MDVPTKLGLERIVEQLRDRLPEDSFAAAAQLITEAMMLIERGVDGERQVIRAERELLEQQQKAVEASRRALAEERREIELARMSIEKRLEVADAREAAVGEIRKLSAELLSVDIGLEEE